MNNHPEELLSAYIAGELSIEEKTSVEEHLSDCEQCMDQVEELRALDRLLSSAEELAPPADFALRVMHSIHEQRQKSMERKFTISGWIGVAVVVFFVFLFLSLQQEKLSLPPDIVQQQTKPAPKPLPEQKPEQTLNPEDTELIAHLEQLENMELIRQYETMESMELALFFNEEDMP